MKKKRYITIFISAFHWGKMTHIIITYYTDNKRPGPGFISWERMSSCCICLPFSPSIFNFCPLTNFLTSCRRTGNSSMVHICSFFSVFFKCTKTSSTWVSLSPCIGFPSSPILIVFPWWLISLSPSVLFASMRVCRIT